MSFDSLHHDPDARRDFDEDRRARLLVALRFAALACVLALSAFSLFDALWGVGELRSLLATRTATLAALMGVLIVSFTRVGALWVDLLAGAACGVVACGSVLVAEIAGSGLSIYRDPLYLTFLGFTLLLPWTERAAAACFLLGIGLYDAMYLATGGMGYLGTFVVSNCLMLTGAGLAVAGVHGINGLRRREFMLRRRLRLLDQQLFAPDPTGPLFTAREGGMHAPLALMLAPLEGLLHNGAGTLLPHAREQLELCRRNALRLATLADDEIARTELRAARQLIEWSHFDAVAHVRGRVAEVQPWAVSRGIALRMQDLPTTLTMQGDAYALDAVIVAMLALALEDARRGGHVRVAVAPRDGGADVVVEDEGVGLGQHDLAMLYEPPLHATESLRRTFLSLAAARCRAERCGYSLRVESVVGEGIRLTLTAPAP